MTAIYVLLVGAAAVAAVYVRIWYVKNKPRWDEANAGIRRKADEEWEAYKKNTGWVGD